MNFVKGKYFIIFYNYKVAPSFQNFFFRFAWSYSAGFVFLLGDFPFFRWLSTFGLLLLLIGNSIGDFPPSIGWVAVQKFKRTAFSFSVMAPSLFVIAVPFHSPDSKLPLLMPSQTKNFHGVLIDLFFSYLSLSLLSSSPWYFMTQETLGYENWEDFS